MDDPRLSADELVRARPLAAIMRGATVALLGGLLGGGLGFLFSIVMAHVLGQTRFGLLVLALNLLIAGAALGAAGADYATVRFVAAADTPARKRGAILTPLLLVLALNGVIAAVTVAFARPISVHLLGEPSFSGTMRALALVLPLTVAAQMFSAALAGLERASGELVRKVVEQGGRILLAPVAVTLGFGLVGAVLGLAAAAALAMAAVGYLLLRALPRGRSIEPIGARAVVGFAWPQTVANGAAQLWEVANVVILAHYANARTVALFGAAFAIARLPGLIYNSFVFRFSPAISRLWERGERHELGDLLKSVTRWVAIVALPLYAVALALPAPLLLIYGSRYQDGAKVLALVAVASLVNGVAGPVETALIMTGKVRLEMAANLGAAILMVLVAGLFLTPTYGLTGAAVSTVLYALLMNGTKLFFVRRSLGMHTVSWSLLRPITAAAGAAALAALVDHYTDLGRSLPGTAALGLGTIAVYALVLVRVVGISQLDRQALALALRPAA